METGRTTWAGLAFEHDRLPHDTVPADVVLGPTPTTRTLASLMVQRPVARALDIGTGCGALARPDVVWFGEMLPLDVWQEAEVVSQTCDLMLVVGTAAEVYPAAGLIGLARAGGAKIIVINPNPSGASALADLELTGKAGELLPPILEP